MRSIFKAFGLVAAFSLVFTACKKDDAPAAPQPSQQEFKFIRVLVSDAGTVKLTQVNPVDGSTQAFDAAFPNATLYVTASKRFAALLHGAQNHVEFFDSGLEFHGDHVDVKGTPKFCTITADGVKPTHFKSRGEETLIFNDGEGTLSVAHEHDFHSSAKMEEINAGLSPHHGAMAQFDNGNYAVTVFDAGSPLPGPHGVKIINKSGQEIHPVAIDVSRLHGNATDGHSALFGVEGGILVVDANGGQRIVPNPAGFGDVRLGTVLEAAGANKFIGFSALKGAYFIDIVNDKIVPIFESTEIFQCKVDYAGDNLFVLMKNGNLKIFDLSTGVQKKEGNIISAIVDADVVKPVLEATSRYIYVTAPSTGELLKINVADFSSVSKIKVSAQPSKLAILGFETNESH